jgi:hypothetical protein
MIRKTAALVAIGGIVLAAGPAAIAHHGAAGLFDETRTVEVTGQVREWLFVNPHPILVLEVPGQGSQVEVWDVYFGPAAATLMRGRGYSESTFVAGETLTIVGHPAVAEGARGLDVFGSSGRVTRENGKPVP